MIEQGSKMPNMPSKVGSQVRCLQPCTALHVRASSIKAAMRSPDLHGMAAMWYAPEIEGGLKFVKLCHVLVHLV